MIRWLTAPEFLSDEELLREYEAADRKGERASALLVEIRRRELDAQRRPAPRPT